MTVRNADIAQEALDKAAEVRQEAGLPFGTPVNVFDLCERLIPKVRVWFADYSMEGCYSRSDRPLIEVSAMRPLGRRVFNTAHELGHHALGHLGTRLDEQLKKWAQLKTEEVPKIAALIRQVELPAISVGEKP